MAPDQRGGRGEKAHPFKAAKSATGGSAGESKRVRRKGSSFCQKNAGIVSRPSRAGPPGAGAGSIHCSQQLGANSARRVPGWDLIKVSCQCRVASHACSAQEVPSGRGNSRWQRKTLMCGLHYSSSRKRPVGWSDQTG